MRGKIASAIVVSLLGTACAYTPVTDAQTAITLADKACDESWGTQSRINGQEWHIDRKDWRARVIGDHWKVWTGDEKQPNVSMNVPLDGRKPDSGSCDLLFQD